MGDALFPSAPWSSHFALVDQRQPRAGPVPSSCSAPVFHPGMLGRQLGCWAADASISGSRGRKQAVSPWPSGLCSVFQPGCSRTAVWRVSGGETRACSDEVLLRACRRPSAVRGCRSPDPCEGELVGGLDLYYIPYQQSRKPYYQLRFLSW